MADGLAGPINYYDMIPDFRREALLETQNRVGQQAVISSQMQNQQAQKENARRDEFYTAMQSATPDKLPDLRRQFPEFAQNIQQEIGIQSSEHAAFVNDALNNLSVAAASNDPGQVAAAITRGSPALASIGVSPEQAMGLYQNDPQQFNQLLTATRLATLPIDKQIETQQNQQKIDETMRANRAGESVQWANVDIARQNAALRGMELKDKSLDRQIAQETNLLKLDELRQKQAENQGKIEQAKSDRQAAGQGAVDTFSTALDSLKDIEQSPGLSKAVGVRSAFPTVPGSEAANFEARLDTFKAQTFLPMVASLKGMGALSDAEGKKLSDAVGALSPKMSEEAFRGSLKKIRGTLENKLGTVKKQYGYQEPTQQQSQQQSGGGNYSSLWGD